MLEPDYRKARLLEIEVGRRYWQSTASPKNALNFYRRVVKPLRQLQRLGVLEKLEEITASGDRTPIAVEITGQVNLPG
jgi:hypothetical protein